MVSIDEPTALFEGARLVRGQVSRGDGRSVAQLGVAVVSCELRKQIRIATGLTDSDGRFTVVYTWTDKEAPNLRVDVLDRNGATMASSMVLYQAAPEESVALEIGAPAVPMAAFDRIHVDVARMAERSGLAIENLQDTDEQPDVAFVAAAAGHHREEVARVVGAYRFAVSLLSEPVPPTDVNALATTVYAALGGLPEADPVGLLDRDPAALQANVEAAVEAGVVTSDALNQVPYLRQALQERRVTEFLGGPSTVVTALRTLATPVEASRAIAEIALRHGPGQPDFWAALDAEDRVPAGVRQSVRDSVAFLEVSDDNSGLLEKLLGPERSKVDAVRPAALVSRTPGDWLKLAGQNLVAQPQVDIPRLGVDQPAARAAALGRARVAAIEPQIDPRRAEHYAVTLTEAIERRFPTHKLAYEVSRDQDPASLFVSARTDVTQFIANNPDLHLLDTPVPSLFTGDPERDQARVAGLKNPQGTVRLVTEYQRIYKLLPDLAEWARATPPAKAIPSRYALAGEMMRDGLRSAVAISALSKAHFADRYAATAGDRGAVEATYERARLVANASLVISAGMQGVASPVLSTAIPQAVDWEQLFGATETCECGQCQSVHSPSAYLVDCLRFLDDAGALNALRARRDDLLDTILTCENSNTLVPYIDLANEVLEHHVAPDWFTPFDLSGTVEPDLVARRVSPAIRQGFAAAPNAIELSQTAEIFPIRPGHWHLFDDAVLYSLRATGGTIRVESAAFQTTGSEDELRAAPQHTITKAYDTLAAAVYPWSAPFHLPWAEIYGYLDRIEVRTAELIDTFAPVTTPSAARLDPPEAHDAAAGTYLGLSPVEFQIIAGQKLAGPGPIVLGQPDVHPEDFWGYARNTVISIVEWDGSITLAHWYDAVWRVPQFLSRSGLSYIELLGLLGCYVINPSGALVITSRDPADPTTCELDKLEIQGVAPADRVPLASTIHRLVRLRRALGWSLRDLDRTLVALHATGMEHDPLVAVSIVERLRRRTGLDPAELVGWFGNLDHAAYYDVNDDDRPRLRSFYDEAFRVPEAAEPDTPFVADARLIGGTITAHRVRLAARLGISTAELDRLRADARVLPPADQDRLGLDTLSALFRYSSLARAVNLGVDDVLDAMDAFGFAPFATGPNDAVIARAVAPLRFIQELDRLAAAGLAPADAAYVFTDQGTRDRAPALDQGALVAAVNALVDGVRPVLSTLEFPTDASPELVTAELVKLGWAEPRARDAGLFFAGRTVYTTPLAAAFAPPALPPDATAALRAARERLRHDRDAGLLSVQGALTTAERDLLLDHAPANFIRAVTALYDQPRAYARAKLAEVLPAERSTPLNQVPANLTLPRPLAVALRFDADRRLLTFRGDPALLGLMQYPAAPLDPVWTAFQAAVDALGTTIPPATVTVDPDPAANGFFAADADINAMLDGTAPPEARCAYALSRIRPWRWRVESDRAVSDALSGPVGLAPTTLGLCRSIWADLVVDPATGGPSELVRSQTAFSAAAGSPVAAAVRRLHKLGVLVNRLAAPATVTAWLLSNAAAVGGPALTGLPAASQDQTIAWDEAAAVLDLVRSWRDFRSNDGTLLDLMDIVGDPTAVHADWWRLAATIRNWEGEEVEAATASSVFPSGFANPGLYLRLLAQMRLARRCGVPVGILKDWYQSLSTSVGGLWTGSAPASTAAQVKAGVRAKVGRESWLQTATEVNDPLRERRRDALLDYLLSRPGSALPHDADGLFAYLLIDAQMAACMPTSRIVRAVGSVQTFMQRALMGLEPGVMVDADAAQEWNTWRKQYRVWEANRKVFLYPENWLEPELRDDKSSLFAEVESRLLQSALPAPALTQAVADYVDGVRALSDLEVVGAYRQSEILDGRTVDVLHLVGRSNSLPRHHYYRRVEKVADMRRARWTAWEKLDVDIDSDYVLPVLSGSDAYLLWPVVTPLVPKATAGDPALPKQWEIKLAWTRRKGGTWLPKQVGTATVIADNDQDVNASDAFRFRTQTLTDGITVECGLVRTIRTGQVDPHELVPKVEVGAPIDNGHAADAELLIWPLVVDETGTPLADVTIDISEWVNPATAGIIGLNAPTVRHFTERTNAQGRLPSGGTVLQGRGTRTGKWLVQASLPPGIGAEFASPRVAFVTIENPAPHAVQIVPVRIRFHRKPVVSESTQAGSVGMFFLDRTGTVSAHQWNWNTYRADSFLPANTVWREHGYVESAGSDDRLFMPEQAGTPLLPHTPGVFRLRPLAQAIWAPMQHYALAIGTKRYQISYRVQAKYRPEPVVVTAFHPYAETFANTIALHGERELMLRGQQFVSDRGATFQSLFIQGTPSSLASAAAPAEEVSFDWSGAFSSYNWELFFHLPLSVAVQLTRNQRFEEAQAWLHYIYDPTSVEAVTFAPKYCWKFRPFFEATPESLAGLLGDLGQLHEQLEVLAVDPFNPYAIARLRIVAFMKKTVMAYLDNLIAWGDQLFARGTTESINEATQLYLLAHQILGARPQRVPARAKPTPQTYRSLTEVAVGQDPALSQLGLIAVEVSSFVAPSAATASGAGGSLGTMMYFCAPKNDKLLGYWDTVEDRLFKLRHCLDIEGRFHIPALFDPPIDPALLVRARATGVDISAVLADATAPLPHYRFTVLAQKATELASEVRALGAALLSALEKRDGEALTLLRQRHELSMLPLVEIVRRKQIDDAKEQAEGLRRSRKTAAERRDHYQRQLGKFSAGDDLVDLPSLPSAVITGSGDASGIALSQYEVEHLSQLETGNNLMIIGSGMNVLAGVLNALPDSAFPIKWGGSHVGAAASAIGAFFSLLSANANFHGNRAATIGTYARRQDDWIFQHNLAVNEMRQLDKQIAAADIRAAIAEQELDNHQRQTDNSKEVEAYLRTKFTSQQLYDWEVGQLSALYFAGYRLAHTMAKRAERALRQELGRESSDYVAFGYWDDLRKGLLSGERLFHDLKRMEVAYLEDNAREYEIVKNVSLEALNPAALVELRQTGVCEFSIPEWAFDLDYPGHYLRRLKTVAVTIPCVVGPYSSVNCTLTLQSSSIRISPSSAGAYPRRRQQGMPADDPRFVDRYSAAQSIVTSSGQHDTGMFETNLRDERYLPFEGSGAISRWRVELPADSNSIDLSSVTDVILHLRYTAREGGTGLARAAGSSLAAILRPTDGASLFRLFSMRQEFPDHWYALLSGAAAKLGPLELDRRRFPLLFGGKRLSVLESREYYCVTKEGITPLSTVQTGGLEVELRAPAAAQNITVRGATQRVDLAIDPGQPDSQPIDLLVICRYTAEKVQS